MRELHLFAGAGGGILGGLLLGHVPVCAVELEAYPRSVLIQRQRDGILPWFPVWDDVRTFDGNPWRGSVDIVAGGFPCQDISAAGKGAGIDGERSGLWSEFARIIGEVRPRFVFVENSPMLVNRGLGRVLGDLAALGYDAEWCVLGAVDAGAPHKRERIWILANASRGRFGESSEWENQQPRGTETKRPSLELAHTQGHGWIKGRPEPTRQQGGSDAQFCGSSIPDSLREGLPKSKQVAFLRAGGGQERGTTRELRRTFPNASGRLIQRWRGRIRRWLECKTGTGTGPRRGGGEGASWWAVEPALGRVAYGVARRGDRLKAIGNGQVSIVAALAFTTLHSRLMRAV